MPKVIKKPKVVVEDKKAVQKQILMQGVYFIFDRTPQGSVLSKEAGELIDKINEA